MNGTTIVSRRLEPEGCIAAGSQVDAEAKGLADEKITLPDEVTTRVSAVASWTERIQQHLHSGNKMWEVDRGTDRAVAAFDDALEAKATAFDGAELLPLTDADQQRLALAVAVRSHILPQGTGFLKLPFYKQWVRLTQIKKAITEKEGDLITLGLGQEAARVIRWIELYGGTLGVTEAANATVDQLAVAVDGWHKAWEELAVAVLYHYKGDTAEQEKVRSKLLGPYERVAELERAEVRKRRAKRKTDKQEDY